MDSKDIREAIEALSQECVCLGYGVLSGEWVYGRGPVCTCGGGDPTDITTLHTMTCDSVPCPFCQV